MILFQVKPESNLSKEYQNKPNHGKCSESRNIKEAL